MREILARLYQCEASLFTFACEQISIEYHPPLDDDEIHLLLDLAPQIVKRLVRLQQMAQLGTLFKDCVELTFASDKNVHGRWHAVGKLLRRAVHLRTLAIKSIEGRHKAPVPCSPFEALLNGLSSGQLPHIHKFKLLSDTSSLQEITAIGKFISACPEAQVLDLSGSYRLLLTTEVGNLHSI